MVNQPIYTGTYIAAAVTGQIKEGQGVLHQVNITETAAGTIAFYDNTAAQGTTNIVAIFKASVAEGSYNFDRNFTNGLKIVTGAASKITVTYL